MDKLNETCFAPRPELFEFHGIWLTYYFTDNWEDLQNFQARADDVVVASYPKAGCTWVSHILELLLFDDASSEYPMSIPLNQRVPTLEMTIVSKLPGSETAVIFTGTQMVENQPNIPRLIKTHLPFQLLPKSFWEKNSKIVYVARNAKDSVVSYFHFDRMTKVQPEPGDWGSYLKRFLEGKMLYGSWFNHVSGWWKKKQGTSNIHYMFYEDLAKDTGREIDKLCSFLNMRISDEKKNRILMAVQFEVMKENKMVNSSDLRIMDFSISTFIRKGKVGDWENHFTVAQNKEFDEIYKNKMTDPTLQFRTKI